LKNRFHGDGMGRRLFHLVGCLVLAILALVISRDLFLWLLLSLATAFLLVDVIRLTWPVVNRLFVQLFSCLMRQQETTGLNASTYVLVGSLLTLLLFDRDIAVAGLIFLGAGDAIAGMVGERWGRHKLLNKSLEGTAAFFIFSLVVGLIFKYAALDISLVVLILGALSAAIVELLPLPVNDNLAIPLLSAAIMTGLAR